jgi:serine protein kinase
MASPYRHSVFIGMYDEINSFVSNVKDAAENGSSKEMAFVLVGSRETERLFYR